MAFNLIVTSDSFSVTLLETEFWVTHIGPHILPVQLVAVITINFFKYILSELLQAISFSIIGMKCGSGRILSCMLDMRL
jgi:hypothetical protein